MGYYNTNMGLMANTRVLYRNWPSLVYAKQARMAFPHQIAKPPRARCPLLASGCQICTPNGQISHRQNSARSLSSCLFDPAPPPIMIDHCQKSPHGSPLLSKMSPCLQHYLTRLWMPEKHTQRTNSNTDPAPLALGLAACSPPYHPPIVIHHRQKSPQGSPLLSRTISYLQRYLTGL